MSTHGSACCCTGCVRDRYALEGPAALQSCMTTREEKEPMKEKIEQLLNVVKTLDEMYLYEDAATEREVYLGVQHLRKAVDALRLLRGQLQI